MPQWVQGNKLSFVTIAENMLISSSRLCNAGPFHVVNNNARPLVKRKAERASSARPVPPHRCPVPASYVPSSNIGGTQ